MLEVHSDVGHPHTDTQSHPQTHPYIYARVHTDTDTSTETHPHRYTYRHTHPPTDIQVFTSFSPT